MSEKRATITDYKEYYGQNTEQMPKLIADGRVPIIVPQLLQKRLESVGTSDENYFWNNYFDTGDGIAYHPDGRVRIVPSATNMRSINPQSNIKNGALVLSDNDEFESLVGTDFSRKDIDKYANKLYKSAEQVSDNPLWIKLAGGDISLLKEYAKKDFELAKKKGYSSERMGVWLHDAPETPIMRLCYINRFFNSSSAYGLNGLYHINGRLVGVSGGAAVEVPKARARDIYVPLENIVSVINNPDYNRRDMIKAVTQMYQPNKK
jgi:hypothetical protein